MTSSESSTTGVQKNLPFGTLPDGGGDTKEGGKRRRSRRGGRRRRRRKGAPDGSTDDGAEGDAGDDDGGDEEGGESTEGDADAGSAGGQGAGRERRRPAGDRRPAAASGGQDAQGAAHGAANQAGTKRKRRGRKRDGQNPDGPRDADRSGGGATEQRPRRDGGPKGSARAGHGEGPEDPEERSESGGDDGETPWDELPGGRDPRASQPTPREAGGMFIVDKGGIGLLRQEEYQWLPSKWDIYVPKRLVQQFKLRDGMLVFGRVSKGFKHKLQLDDIQTIDGKDPKVWKNKLAFAGLTSIDPDFHYAIGDVTDEVAMRVVDLLAPIGRGQRAILVAPPRAGKTTLLRQFAAGIEAGYPDVHLLVLLIDERPEEATEWQRSVTRGKVFVSTADESAKHHIELAETVWKRACRLVEAGEDVVLLLDSITRLARAYNNQASTGRTMSGGLDSRAMERPRKIFGSARNTVEAGSLTIIGTCLVDTGSRMDQMVFEEFKGTGNCEIVLSRKLADRRIFPAIDVEKSGTRKEEKIVGTKRLKQIHTLRRVLARMHFAEAMDLLVTRLGEAAKTADFLERFNVDPEA
ncbi:MAG: transcription termination factor Rho [Planctomycetota bacterium]